jgi:uncharacterized membrane protein
MLRILLAISLILLVGVSEAAEFWRIEELHWPRHPMVSRDGTLVVGSVRIDNRSEAAAYWSPEKGLELIPLPDGYDFLRAQGMSGDATAISGHLFTTSSAEAYVWFKDTGYQILEQPIDLYSRSEALDVSANGTVVGWFTPSPTDPSEQAFVWTADHGMMPLAELPGGDSSSKAFAVSDDGSVIVGFANNRGQDQAEPVIWTRPDEVIRLADELPPDATGTASAVSRDGRTVVGAVGRNDGFGEVFRWTKDTGMQFIGVSGSATGVSDDGTVIIGVDKAGAYFWKEGLGSRRVSMSLIHDHGLHVSVDDLRTAYSVSGDGTVVVGQCGRDGDHSIFMAPLTDDALPGDVNFDDRVDLDDFAILRKGFGKGIYRDQGDTNLDRRVDLTDFGILKANLGNVREAAVPEPASLALLLGGFVLLAAARVRRP